MLTARPPKIDSHIKLGVDETVHKMGLREWFTACGQTGAFWESTTDPVDCSNCIKGIEAEKSDFDIMLEAFD